MFISSEDIKTDPELSKRIKAWAGNLNLEAKKPNPPIFKVNGPHDLPCRSRSSKGYSRADKHSFSGGEEFRFSSVVIDQDIERGGLKVAAMFTPVSAQLSLEVASMALEFEVATQCMEGFEEWSQVVHLASEAQTLEKSRRNAELVKLPTVEESRASQTWGAW